MRNLFSKFMLVLAVAVVLPLGGCASVKETKALAEQGDVYSQYAMGWAYYLGREIPQNYNEAAKWWELAAKKGLRCPQFFRRLGASISVVVQNLLATTFRCYHAFFLDCRKIRYNRIHLGEPPCGSHTFSA